MIKGFLNSCPFCGGECRWCDSKPDEDGDFHKCDHIICTECSMDFVLTSEESHQCVSLLELKKLMFTKFNTRSK